MLALAASTVGFNQTAFLVLMPLVVAQTGVRLGEIGLAAMAGTLAFLVASPLWGRTGAALGPHLLSPALAGLMLLGQLLVALLFMSDAQDPRWALAVLVASRILYGLGSAGVMPHAQAAIVRSTPPERQPGALARLSAGLSAGRILGSLVTSLATISVLIPPAVMALSPLVLLATRIGGAKRNRHDGDRAPNRRILPLVMIGFAVTLAFGQIQTTLAALLQQRLQVGPADATGITGILYALVVSAMIAVQVLLVPRLPPRLDRTLRIGALLLAAGAGLVAAGSSLVPITAGLLAAGAGVALATPAYSAWLAQLSAQEHQAANAGWLAGAHVLGQGVGALTGTYAFDLLAPLPFILCAAIAVAILAASFAVAPPGRPETSKGAT
jgi:MFS family permease